MTLPLCRGVLLALAVDDVGVAARFADVLRRPPGGAGLDVGSAEFGSIAVGQAPKGVQRAGSARRTAVTQSPTWGNSLHTRTRTRTRASVGFARSPRVTACAAGRRRRKRARRRNQHLRVGRSIRRRVFSSDSISVEQ